MAGGVVAGEEGSIVIKSFQKVIKSLGNRTRPAFVRGHRGEKKRRYAPGGEEAGKHSCERPLSN